MNIANLKICSYKLQELLAKVSDILLVPFFKTTGTLHVTPTFPKDAVPIMKYLPFIKPLSLAAPSTSVRTLLPCPFSTKLSSNALIFFAHWETGRNFF